MTGTIFKVGLQAEADPYTFVMSTAAIDRMGDSVKQNWRLKDFKRNPIALWQHNAGQPIGVWENVQVTGGQLMGRLKLAEKGTSELIDTVRSLIEQRVLKAVSVGFRSNKQTPLDEEKGPYGPLELDDNELLECSVVSIPANQEALSTAKSVNQSVLARIVAEPGDNREAVPAFKQLKITRESGNHSTRKTIMPLSRSEQIAELRDNLVKHRDLLLELDEKLDAAETDEDREDLQREYDEETARMERTEANLQRKLDMEQRMAAKAIEAQGDPEPKEPAIEGELIPAGQDVALRAFPQSRPAAEHQPVIRICQNRPKAHRAIATMHSIMLAHVERRNPVEIAARQYKDEPEIEFLVRTATQEAAPANAGWAAELVRDTYRQFLDLVWDASIYGRAPGLRLNFDGAGKIMMPRATGSHSDLGGGFVGVGAPIPVKETTFGMLEFGPQKMAVITTYLKEMVRQSNPALEPILREHIVNGTALILDTIFQDDQARTTIRPPGIKNIAGVPNISVSTGSTVAAIIADCKAMIGRLLDGNGSDTATWFMNPQRILGLRTVQDAASGAFTFREDINAGTFMGYPFVSSKNVTVDEVHLISDDALVHGNDYNPVFETSDQATIVFDDSAPEHIVGGPGRNPPADGVATTQPVRSMFQVDGIAMKMTLGLSWEGRRETGIQVLTGVAW